MPLPHRGFVKGLEFFGRDSCSRRLLMSPRMSIQKLYFRVSSRLWFVRQRKMFRSVSAINHSGVGGVPEDQRWSLFRSSFSMDFKMPKRTHPVDKCGASPRNSCALGAGRSKGLVSKVMYSLCFLGLPFLKDLAYVVDCKRQATMKGRCARIDRRT